jgi:hypothetical protein
MKSGNSEDREYNGHQDKDRECNDQQEKDAWECVENKWFNMKYTGKYLSVEILSTHECMCNILPIIIFLVFSVLLLLAIVFSVLLLLAIVFSVLLLLVIVFSVLLLLAIVFSVLLLLVIVLSVLQYFHTKVFPYIFHIKPLIFNTFSCSHSLSDFHEMFNIKPQNKYSFFFL